MFCQNCGNKLNDNTKFCGGCGNPVGQAPPQQKQNQYAPPPQYQQQPFQQQQSYAPQYSGPTMVCYHHPSKQAVATCSVDGKGICKDCYDSYGAGMGAGKALCFDCTEEMMKENAREILWLQKQVKKERIWMIVGAITVGLALGIGMSGDMGIAGFFLGLFVGGFVGGSLGTIVNGFSEHGPVIGMIMIIISPVMTLVRFFKRGKQIKRCNKILASDARAIQEMRDYFEYTLTMERSAGVDLATLANKGGELFNNTYAQSVLKNGEKNAQEGLRQSVVTISANGEIIRSFDKRIAQRAAA